MSKEAVSRYNRILLELLRSPIGVENGLVVRKGIAGRADRSRAASPPGYGNPGCSMAAPSSSFSTLSA